jgi:hypothetical protein
MEFLTRFIVGGLIVSAFAAFGDVFKPKTFAGLFNAAPSVALATLGLTIAKDGHAYGAMEGRSMVAAAIAFSVYAWFARSVLLRCKTTAGKATAALIPVWGCVAGTIWYRWLQ